MSYDALDNGETVEIESIADLSTPSMEDQAIANEMCGRLPHALDALPKTERELIRAIYFERLTEKDYAKSSGLTQTGVSYRRRKILSKLKLFFDILGSFC